jgi:hypothetical protein
MRASPSDALPCHWIETRFSHWPVRVAVGAERLGTGAGSLNLSQRFAERMRFEAAILA